MSDNVKVSSQLIIDLWNGADEETHFVTASATKRIDNGRGFQLFKLYTERRECHHCKGDHNPMICPQFKCSKCNKFGHYDLICGTVTKPP